MVVPQRKFREIVFQMVFSQDVSAIADPTIISSLLDQLMVTKKTLFEAYDRMQFIYHHVQDIDALITQVSSDYNFNRISIVEKNILRLAIFELIYDDAIPPKVAISEAIRLSRKFGSPEGGSFVNAILDAIYHKEVSNNKLDIHSKNPKIDRTLDLKQVLREY